MASCPVVVWRRFRTLKKKLLSFDHEGLVCSFCEVLSDIIYLVAELLYIQYTVVSQFMWVIGSERLCTSRKT